MQMMRGFGEEANHRRKVNRRRTLRAVGALAGAVVMMGPAVVMTPAVAVPRAPFEDPQIRVFIGDPGSGWSYVPPQRGTWKTKKSDGSEVESGGCDGLPPVKSTGQQQICTMIVQYRFPTPDTMDLYLPSWTVTSPSGIDHTVSRYSATVIPFNGITDSHFSGELTTETGKLDVSGTYSRANVVVAVPDGALRDLAAKDEVAAAAANVRVLSAAAVLGSSQCQQVTLGDGESFRGTAGSDCVKIDVAPDANVTVNMLGGSDTVAVTVPDGSSAQVDLGASNDTLVVTGGGDATVKGGHGDDVIVMGNGDDDVKAGPGADFVVGSGGKDEIRGAESSARGNVRGLDGLAAVR